MESGSAAGEAEGATNVDERRVVGYKLLVFSSQFKHIDADTN